MTHEKSGRESDREGAERIPSGIRSEAKTISSTSARTGKAADDRIYKRKNRRASRALFFLIGLL